MKCWCGSDRLVDTFHLEYVRCEKCGTFISRKNTPKDYYSFENYWHHIQVNKYGFPPIEGRAKSDFLDRIPFWWDKIKEFNPNSVLEIGCGHGGFLHFCKKHGVEKVLGIEIAKETCDFAKKEFDLEVLQGKYPNVEIEECFDLVCAFDVLEHLNDPIKSLEKMKKQGKLIEIQTPCYRDEGNYFMHFNGDEHLYIFTQDSLFRLFKKVGIEVLKYYRGAFNQDITIIGKA